MKKNISIIYIIIVSATVSYAQVVSDMPALAKKCWHNFDLKEDKVMGASVNKTYRELLINKKPKKTVIVAVISGGVDIHHKELAGKIWINSREVPNNNIDDDHNGYVDDVNGWNFIGNAKGENITFENFEYARIYKNGVGDANYELAKKLYEAELTKRNKEKDYYEKVAEQYPIYLALIKDKTGKEVKNLEDLRAISTNDNDVLGAIYYLSRLYKGGFSEKDLLNQEGINRLYLEKYLNLELNARALIGDNTNDINDNHYGNPDVIGPNTGFGTFAAGVIAGIRNNEMGIDGVATDVKIMVLRAIPRGDERDKDVALAIKYAVDNGADIINISFSKKISPQKNFVDDAIRFAEKKNVLIVRNAGDNSEDIDQVENFPSRTYLDKSEATNFICVGASGMKRGDSLASVFSNYGQNQVDIFAPGEEIISTDTNNVYSFRSGTSEATVVVTGIAALILSYHPELKPKELIGILLESSTDCKDRKVLIPSKNRRERAMIKFGTLCKCGGIVNAFEAMKMADAKSIKN